MPTLEAIILTIATIIICFFILYRSIYMDTPKTEEPTISAQELKDQMAAKELETLRSWNKNKK
jgi:hypothetical protein